MKKISNLKKLVGSILVGIGLTTGCGEHPRRTHEEYADLNRDTFEERVTVSSFKEAGGVCGRILLDITIDELKNAEADGGFLRSAQLTYNNKFFKPRTSYFDLPVVPQSVGFRDTNEDGYLDIMLHGAGLESYVIEQDGSGGFKPPKKVDIHSYMLLDKARDLYQRSLSKAQDEEDEVAIHLSEQALRYLDAEKPLHHSALNDVYKTLLRLYEESGNKEKAEGIKAKSLNLQMFRGRI